MPHTAGTSGQSGGNPVTPGDVYISSSITIKGVPDAAANNVKEKLHDFLELFIPTLLTKKYTGRENNPYPLNPDTDISNSRVPDIELGDKISFSQYYDFIYPHEAPFKGKTYLHLENKSKRVLLRRDKSKKKIPLLKLDIAPTPIPFEIQIRSNNSAFLAPRDIQVDFILFYLAKVGYAAENDAERIRTAFKEVYIYFYPGAAAEVDDLGSLEINFTAPVQIGVNDRNCGGYTIPGSDKRTAIAVLHDKVECLAALINDISSNPITGPILPQYVAYDHGLVTDLEDADLLEGLPTTPVDWNTWYGTAANNPTSPLGSFNDMTGPNKSNTNLKNWVAMGKVLVFRSPLGAGTLSIYLSGFPFTEQIEPGQFDENNYPEAKDGAFIRLCNGNNPYDARVNEYNGNSAYDDRFIFYDQYYRVLANITPGESVRVTWCATQATPGWISIVGT